MSDAESAIGRFKEAIEQVKTRRVQLLTELNDLDKTLNEYGIDVTAIAGDGDGKKSSAGASKVKNGDKSAGRKRRPAPSFEWLEEILTKGKMAQDEIVKAAAKAGLSETGAVVILKKNTEKFKSEKAPRMAGSRGFPQSIWSLSN